MSELGNRLERLVLRLDHMAMRVEQAVLDALTALENTDVEAAETVERDDAVIDREEVEIEQECIRLLALYQPAAIDLRTLCTIIKVNNDLERIADLASTICRAVPHVRTGGIDLAGHTPFERLKAGARDILGRTARMLSVTDADSAYRIIDLDGKVDEDYGAVIQSVLNGDSPSINGFEGVLTVMNLAKALERIGDLCTNIAEDIIFLRTGDIVRHRQAFGEQPD